MLAIVIPICLALCSLAVLLTFIRLLIGPHQPDRILALDTININAIALIVLFGLWLDSNLFFEAALLIALMGFITTVVLAKFMTRGDIIE
ncbi:multisubunit potassium/proton antiporter, PhaF subunit (TC 2.A.63.1.1) [Pseudomonas duriflava]|uniref:Multisubunit potassium/proton antiporter, PhaF subunit (TC 2.A.63.1.1) n=1 Tax=Pseudomonas duriflava TaxID=459528 RepID=A0A562PU91_9PSED|nr:K+/H+ antiporter subunit F [Pseudomonas duriflava]TWI48005.1 multisubunit potassium/proton antiporter, PhaF subunit (TC 2.A.63.1.1) [Pseudomonas duriflava]